MELKKNLEKLANLQQLLLNIDESNFEETKKIILNSDYLQTEKKCCYLVHEILDSFMCRPKHGFLLINLINSILQSQYSEYFKSPFHNVLTRDIILNFDDNHVSNNDK